MNESYIRNVVEAAMLAAGKSLTLAELGQLFDEFARPKVEDVRAALDALAAEYADRGIELKETAAGFRIQVRRELSGEISRLWPERPARYSRALLETLALIAYRQPITRAEIEAVRGVAVNPNIVKTVIERNWVRVVGHRDVPGRPELLGTTREFLDYFGLRSLDELPPLAELKAMGEYNLQLELPNAGALGVEGQATDAAAVPVAELTHEGGTGSAGDGHVAAAAVGEATSSDSAAVAVGAVGDADAAEATTPDEGAATVLAEAAVLEVVSVEIAAEAEQPVSSEGADFSSEATDSDESDVAAGTAYGGESVDAVEDGADEEADEDELSADGQGTRELVASPGDQDQ